MKRSLPFVIIGAVALLAAAGGAAVYQLKRQQLAAAPSSAQLASGKPGAKPPHVRGGSNAPVTLEEFGDFQCPPCAGVSHNLLRLEHDYGDRLRVIFRQLPLQTHNHAAQAARAAEAAGLQGRFWEMHDLLYREQLVWKRETNVTSIFESYAAGLKLDLPRFRTDVEGDEVKARLRADQERATSINATNTPTIFLNGALVPAESFAEPRLRSAIDDLLGGKNPFPTPSP